MTGPFLVDNAGRKIGERALPDDTPLTDLKLFESNLKAGISGVMLKNAPLADSLGRNGVDVDTIGMLQALEDVVSDYLGLELMRLENME